MNKKLEDHIKKMQRRSVLSLTAMLAAFLSVVLGILFFFFDLCVSVAFFIIVVICAVCLIRIVRSAKRELEEKAYEPVRFTAKENLSFEKISDIFENLTEERERISISENVRFFRFCKIFNSRIVLYKTADFNKKEFDSAKDRINKKANKELNISHLVNSTEAAKMVRLNVICADTLNGELSKLMSQNAHHNLTRVEGIINISVVGNEIIIPPIYGECDLMEIGRYKGVVKFIEQIILNKTDPKL